MKSIRVLRSALWIGVAGIAAGGCGSITGLDGTSEYACKAPPGVRCDSVTGTYYNAINGNLPAQRRPSGPAGQAPAEPARRGSTEQSAPSSMPSRATGMMPTVAPAVPPGGQRLGDITPLRSAPRQLRLWIKPWEDGERDLNGESVVYVQVDNGRWLLDAAQRSAREPFAPTRGATASASAAGTRGRSAPASTGGVTAARGAQPNSVGAATPPVSSAAVPATRLLPPDEDARRLQEALQALRPQQAPGPSD
jgi:conjugal transfer pilus assembly protein TraV